MVGSRTTAVTGRVAVPAAVRVGVPAGVRAGIRAGVRVGWARKGATAALGVLVGVVFAGCQSNPEPPPVDAAEFSASPSPTASPTPEPPTLPVKAEKKTRAGAKAFVRHYIRLVNFAMATGETEQLNRWTDDECSTCEAITDRIDKVYKRGGRLEGTGWAPTNLYVVHSRGRSNLLIAAAIRIAPQTLHPGDGEPSTSPRSRGNLDLHLRHQNGGWIIKRLDATQ